MELITSKLGLELVVPKPRFCTDNAVMVAWAGWERMQLGLADPPLSRSYNLTDKIVEIRPRWPIGERDAASVTQESQLASRSLRFNQSQTKT